MSSRTGPDWYRLRTLGGTQRVETLGDVAKHVERSIALFGVHSWDLVLEGTYVARPGQNVSIDSIRKLERSRGQILAGLGYGWRTFYEPKANQWRPAVASIPANTDRKTAEALAIRYAAALFVWPYAVREATKKERGAVAEAACMARWPWCVQWTADPTSFDPDQTAQGAK